MEEQQLDEVMKAVWGKEVLVIFNYNELSDESEMEKHLNYLQLLISLSSKLKVLYHAHETPDFPPLAPSGLRMLAMSPNVEIRFITTEEYLAGQRKLWQKQYLVVNDKKGEQN